MSKRELERRHREEQEATAHAFQEFIKTFQDSSGPPNKLFVRAGILNSETGREEETESGRIYNPSLLLKPNCNTLKNAIECARLLKENKLEKSRGAEKPKSNLELLKEELRLRHLERDARNKTKDIEVPNVVPNSNYADSTDQNTTNLFVANINPKLTELDLMHIFGAYGPLASVKIMWPRSDEKSRNSSNCGFVAYMSRKDGERAIKELKNREDMRIDWGRPVEVPPHPIYMPPELVKLLLPPPFTGLPFNAQPTKMPFSPPSNEKEMQELLYNSLVKVTIPLDKKALMLIHRTIEFVVNEGPMFEAMIMNNEISNPNYQFLFDNKSANHIYYRWKMYSILQGESLTSWSTKKFRMFEGGSIWVPPLVPNYSEGMPECLINTSSKVDKKLLSDAQKNRLIQHIQQLTVNRTKIGEAMIFCLNHGEAFRDIVDIVSSSFDNESTKATKKIARLYLISDVLYNCGLKKFVSLKYRSEFTKTLPRIFEQLQKTYKSLQKSTDKDSLRSRVVKVLRAWDLWKIYTNEFLNKLEVCFNGQPDTEILGDDSCGDEPLDGRNLIKRFEAESQIGKDCVILCNELSDLQKQAERANKDPAKTSTNYLQGFIPSKWETIDPEQVEAQAMSTKKFYDMELEGHTTQVKKKSENESKLSQEREKLRHIEVMVMQYQDELENGKRKLKKGHTYESQLNDYRNHLVTKMKREFSFKIRNTSPVSSDSSPDDRYVKKDTPGKSKSHGGRSKRKYEGRDRHSKYFRNN